MAVLHKEAPALEGLEEAREWVTIEDPDEDRTWLVDVSFLESGWACIYGNGCQGVLTAPAPELEQGCCSYGAHFTDDDDLERVETAALTLRSDQWQFRSKGRSKKGIATKNDEGERVTRMVDDACIFLNRPGFANGPGCALHQAALERGIEPLELKPDVCWQLPLRRFDQVGDDGHVTSTLTEWSRRNWGAGGQEFAWWCTEAPEAFVATEPVYVRMAPELRAITGTAVYELLARYLGERRNRPVRLAHPTVRMANGG